MRRHNSKLPVRAGTNGDRSGILGVALDTVPVNGRILIVCQDPLFANNPGMEFYYSAGLYMLIDSAEVSYGNDIISNELR